jgi:hypothetical protein
VGIVNDDERGRSFGQVGGEPVQAVHHRRLLARRRLDGGELRRRDDRRRQRGRSRQQALTLVFCRAADDRLEQLPRDAEAEVVLQHRALSGYHRHTRGCRTPRGFVEQRRLTDAGRTLDHHDAAPAGDSVSDRPIEDRELRFTLDQFHAARL